MEPSSFHPGWHLVSDRSLHTGQRASGCYNVSTTPEPHILREQPPVLAAQATLGLTLLSVRTSKACSCPPPTPTLPFGALFLLLGVHSRLSLLQTLSDSQALLPCYPGGQWSIMVAFTFAPFALPYVGWGHLHLLPMLPRATTQEEGDVAQWWVRAKCAQGPEFHTQHCKRK